MTLIAKRKQQRDPIPPGYRRVSEVAALIRVCPSTIYHWVRHGKLARHEYKGLFYVHVETARKTRKLYRPGNSTILAPPPPNMVTIAHAASNSGVAVGTIRDWATKELITSQRYGPKLLYVNLNECLELADTMKPGPKPKSNK